RIVLIGTAIRSNNHLVQVNRSAMIRDAAARSAFLKAVTNPKWREPVTGPSFRRPGGVWKQQKMPSRHRSEDAEPEQDRMRRAVGHIIFAIDAAEPIEMAKQEQQRREHDSPCCDDDIAGAKSFAVTRPLA